LGSPSTPPIRTLPWHHWLAGPWQDTSASTCATTSATRPRGTLTVVLPQGSVVHVVLKLRRAEAAVVTPPSGGVAPAPPPNPTPPGPGPATTAGLTEAGTAADVPAAPWLTE